MTVADPRPPPRPPRPAPAAFDAYRLPEWRDGAPDGPDRDGCAPGAPERAWRAGYVWARQGRHDLAWDWWRCSTSTRLAATVQVSRAATLRQFGLHDRARVEDLAGLRLARQDPTVQGEVALAALRIGLVADAVGDGRLGEARIRLAAARAAVDVLGESLPAERQRIRLGWVAAEVTLLAAQDPDARLLDGLPDVAGGVVRAPRRYDAGTRYHLAKGLLFRGVLTRRLALLDMAATLAPPGLDWAVHLARGDLGASDAGDEARRAFARVVAPAHVARLVHDEPGLKPGVKPGVEHGPGSGLGSGTGSGPGSGVLGD